ncbi:MAG: NlpC/P60 family protein [Bacteroidetes bacterium]|nr:NlpC/P60 family protein [Bacteroidota bacterium]
MPRFLIVLFLVVSFETCSAQAEETAIDSEQLQLEWCYSYSNLFGFEIDTIRHEKLFEVAGEWLGTRYCYAGDSKKGVDCSGFANVLYQHVFHVELEGSSKDIYKNIRPVKKNQLQEGDLVFFRIRRKRVSHVGVYLGGNKFIHASVHEGVIISDLDEPYYKKYFYKGGTIETGCPDKIN